MAKKGGRKQQIREEREALAELTKPKTSEGIANVKRQLRTAGKVAIIALVVIWLLALGFRSGLDSMVPIWVALGLTATMGVSALLIRRNFKKSESFGSLLAGEDLPEEEREARLKKLEAQVEKGDAGALLAKAQLEMQDEPRTALETLKRINLDKAQKMIALQARAMQVMIHLNLGEVNAARPLADEIDLEKAPDAKTRGNISAVVAEAWARSGNPIEALELLDKYDADDASFDDIRMQLVRARAFACAHKNDIKGMRSALKKLSEVSPQLPAMFLSGKRIHPLLAKEARKVLEKSGFAPRQKIQMARR